MTRKFFILMVSGARISEDLIVTPSASTELRPGTFRNLGSVRVNPIKIQIGNGPATQTGREDQFDYNIKIIISLNLILL